MTKITDEDRKRYDNAFSKKQVFKYRFLKTLCEVCGLISFVGVIGCSFLEFILEAILFFMLYLGFLMVKIYVDLEHTYLLMKLAEAGELR
ncbi:MAG: hypothetical protein KAJ40_05715 [Alphaproteobacteria bacterium]|nr:hypothetical protein [Alphaproteobacteria bacterium]